ncbi:hypothetical protein F5Y16DRAFT_410056 [Xylariaceae sp. FL0255]|nr:hypothetical protein F5Y16DRAFT_410056 [Xylariaceae sp. FL0255]
MPYTETMTSPIGAALAHDRSASEYIDPDDFIPQNSPLMKPLKPKLEPSDSPVAVSLPLVQPSHGDAVLIYHLGGGKNPDISQEAGMNPLDDGSYESESGDDSEGTMDGSDEEDGIRSNDMSPAPSMARFLKPTVEPPGPTAASGSSSMNVGLRSLASKSLTAASDSPSAPGPGSGPVVGVDLQSLASTALAAVQGSTKGPGMDDRRNSTNEGSTIRRGSSIESPRPVINEMRDREHSISTANRPVLAAPISPYATHSSPEAYSPRQHQPGQVLMHPNNIRSPTHLAANGHGELAPLQISSPKSDSSNQEVLPSIRSQFYEQLQPSPKDLTIRANNQFPHSPPAASSRLGSISSSHASPPVSPNGYRNAIPSPPNTLPATSPYTYTSPPTNDTRPNIFDYSGVPSSKLERPTITSILTPPSVTDKMSIDSVTNPQVGSFVCKYTGCTAQPFQTQYLLNSHANVHSSNRPHYCPVKGCPRSEGGKGFKRKNEMIRHGLVHDSPGYVCPFCPDREHKYPRPDNLQRHVRVHHVDKDKDDPALRDVLAQRPDGPNRGRRRRGVP